MYIYIYICIYIYSRHAGTTYSARDFFSFFFYRYFFLLFILSRYLLVPFNCL